MHDNLPKLEIYVNIKEIKTAQINQIYKHIFQPKPFTENQK
jgi:hypothetical protein